MSKSVKIEYTNWKGETGTRFIRPEPDLRFGSTQWHPEPQWLLHAFDLEKQAYREFAMKDIHSWEPEKEFEPGAYALEIKP